MCELDPDRQIYRVILPFGLLDLYQLRAELVAAAAHCSTGPSAYEATSKNALPACQAGSTGEACPLRVCQFLHELTTLNI